jgi:hypothetical protein
MSADDFEMLADRILAFAKQAIVEDGVLIPISAVVSPEGEVVPLRRIRPPDEKDTASSLVDEILGILRSIARDRKARAVAWCIDMRVVPPGTTEKTDALVVFRESANGEASVLVTPYHGAPGPATVFAGSYTQANQPQIFLSAK